jgi:transposase
VGRTAMSRRELTRVSVIARVDSYDLTLTSAAERLGVSYRQAKRLWHAYREDGPEGLRHGNAGQPSNRTLDPDRRKRVLDLVRTKYAGDETRGEERFGPTLAAEHLGEEDNLHVHPETLRRWMLSEGLWSRVRKSAPHRRRRERKAHFGELVQLDGSFEAWLEGRGPRGCLLEAIDDATGTTWGRFSAEETTWAAAGVLRGWIKRYGIPRALYTDWKNVYVRKPTVAELAAGEVALTQFGRMCATLGIQIIAASSPQAKGRVERGHGTHQDRLIKKLRRKGVGEYEAANVYLAGEYFDGHNARFAVSPASADDFHVVVPRGMKLDEVFRLEETRVLSNDWVMRYANRLFQVTRQSRYAPARARVTVCEYEDGRLEVRYRGQRLAVTEIDPGVRVQALTAPPPPPLGATTVRRASKPAATHPWRRGWKHMQPGLELWQAAER